MNPPHFTLDRHPASSMGMKNMQVILPLLVFSGVVLGGSLLCEDGYTLVEFAGTGSCYWMEEPAEKHTYDEAVAACAADGSALLSASSTEEYTAVTTWLKTDVHPARDIWVGLAYTGPEDGPYGSISDYVWPDGTSAMAEFWAPNEPSAVKSRGVAPASVSIWRSKGYRLDNRRPSLRNSYMCEKDVLISHNTVGYWDSPEGIEQERDPAKTSVAATACSTMYDHIVGSGALPCSNPDASSPVYSARLTVSSVEAAGMSALLEAAKQGGDACQTSDGQSCADILANTAWKQYACLWDNCGSSAKMICEFTDRLE